MVITYIRLWYASDKCVVRSITESSTLCFLCYMIVSVEYVNALAVLEVDIQSPNTVIPIPGKYSVLLSAISKLTP